ncbi:hypothetical protein ACMFMG_003062 [Clarireedia jacksonii]
MGKADVDAGLDSSGSWKKSIYCQATNRCSCSFGSLELPNRVSSPTKFSKLSLTNTRMILRKAGAALAAGCCMVVKPSPETPLSVLSLAMLAEQAGFPKGVFSVLTTSLENTPPLSEALCRHPLVKKVTFTGSVSAYAL